MSTYTAQNPWIPEREAALCNWKPDYNRGFINNMNVSLLVDIMSYSDDQLRTYVRMLKVCGFTGIQIGDCCTTWRACGSWMRAHDVYKVIANEAHANGMTFTTWVWAAEFSGHGWHDEESAYAAADGGSAYDDPKVFAFFNKYYDIYADLAPYSDRLITHFFDPGRLASYDDAVKFAKLLADKFMSANPNIKFGIDTWGCPPDFPQKLTDAGLTGWMLLELPFLPTWREEGKRARFRQGVKDAGCELGAWGWYTAETELDQSPTMNVNARVIKDVYQQIQAQGDHVMRIQYYSEMEAYHLINLPTIYCAGQLLINPDRDPDELLEEVAALMVGEEDRADLVDVLHLVQDARSGDRWDTYWWTEPNYIFNPNGQSLDLIASIRDRAAVAREKLADMVRRKVTTDRIPLPIPVYNILRLMLPHMEQIRRFADFRLKMADLEAEYDAGIATDTLAARIDEIWDPIPDYNCVIGVWGQPEARVQADMVKAFCKKAGIPVPKRPARWYTLKKRMVEHLSVYQRGADFPVYASPIFYEMGMPYGDETFAIIDDLVADGVFLRRQSDGHVCLADWESLKYDFNI